MRMVLQHSFFSMMEGGEILIKYAVFVFFIFVLASTTIACSAQKQEPKVLTKDMIQLFEKGKIKGIPFQAGKAFTMADVEEQWGKPDKMIDNEDIHDYVYNRNGHVVVFMEDENRKVFLFKVYFALTRNEIYEAMGTPAIGKIKTGHVLIYYRGDYKVQFERTTEHKWSIILFKAHG
jgi:hypothetical protein